MAEKSVDDVASKPAELTFEPDSAFVAECRSVFDEVTRPYPTAAGKAISKKEREELNLRDTTLVYGEIGFESFALIFEKIKKLYGKPYTGANGPDGCLQRPGGKFYDLGSGTGKPCVAAAVLHNFEVCSGIEILEGLFSMSLDVVASYNTRGKSRLVGRPFDTEIQMFHGDILKVKFKDWTDGDIVFANSTCFDDALMAKITKIAVGMKKGSFFVSFTKRLPSSDFNVLEYELHNQSWGSATVYIMQKTTEPKDIEEDDDVEGGEENTAA